VTEFPQPLACVIPTEAEAQRRRSGGTLRFAEGSGHSAGNGRATIRIHFKMRRFLTLALCLAFAPLGRSQQVSTRDLSAAWRAPDDHVPAPSSDVCPDVQHRIVGADPAAGAPSANDNDKLLELTIVSLSGPGLAIGDTFYATVDVKNVGPAPLRIPWQSDGEKVVHASADGSEEQYEVADVNFRLRTTGNQRAPMPLETEGALFAHPDNAASYLQLGPGQWVELKAKGTVECALDECPGNLVADERATLTAWWYQRVLTHHVKDCNDDHSSRQIRQVESAPFPVVVHAPRIPNSQSANRGAFPSRPTGRLYGDNQQRPGVALDLR
jgi:hypothetical protein